MHMTMSRTFFKGIVKQGQKTKIPHFCWPGSNCGIPFMLPKNTICDVMESKPVARVESQATCTERVEGCRRQWPCRVRLYQKGSNWGFWYKQYVKVPAKQGILVLVVESFQICLIWQGFQFSWCLDQVWSPPLQPRTWVLRVHFPSICSKNNIWCGIFRKAKHQPALLALTVNQNLCK